MPIDDAAVVYVVRVAVDAAIAADYRDWLGDHVAEILTLPGFTGAAIYREECEDGAIAFVVHYRLASRAALDDYFREHAPRLRAEGLARFGGRMTATRAILTPA
jgi:antibiotic biosynthesis monooxygenase (ABM) superfamily enzyme